ncbi:hypothetical protein ACWF9G_22940 [Nocardia sp. NPDC055029]
MLFPHNDDPNSTTKPSTGWQSWLAPTIDPAPAQPNAQLGDSGADPAINHGGDVHIPTTEGADWSQWISESSPAQPAVATPAAAGEKTKSKWGKGPLIGAVLGGGVAAAAVAAGVVVLVSDPTAPGLPTPAATPSSVATATTSPVVDPVLGGGPSCAATRQPNVVVGNGTGSTGSGPDAILAFQHAYYTTRSGAAARKVTTPDASVSAVEVVDAGIATIPPGTRHCITITPSGKPDQFKVVIAEVRPDLSVRSYQQLVTVAAVGADTLITEIGAVE